MKVLLGSFLWSGVCVLVGWVVWGRVSAEIRVYFIILLNALYLAGIFLIYAFIRHLPV